MSERTRYRVMYAGTGTNWPQETQLIKPGCHGEFEFLRKDDETASDDGDAKFPVVLNAEDAMASCKLWFNRRCIQAAKYQNDDPNQALISKAEYIYGEHVDVWVEKWVDGSKVFEGSIEECAALSEPGEDSVTTESGSTESSTKSTAGSSRKKSGTKPSQTSQLATAEV